VYFSLLKKIDDKRYQKFDQGQVIKFDFYQLSELLFCLENDPPQNFDTWREKNFGKSNSYKIRTVFNPFLTDVILTSKTPLKIQGLAMKIESFRDNKHLVSFILSPYELT
jgi:hypothetical protein